MVDYLTTGTVRNAVNVPSVSREVLEKLGPWLELAHKLGSIAGQLGLPSGTTGVVVTEVDPNADAATKGLARGAVILGVNNRNVTGVEDLEAAIQAAKSENRSAILLRVRVRGAPEQSIPVRLR